MSLLIVPVVLFALGSPPENQVFRQLTAEGVPVDLKGSGHIRLEKPTMADGLDAAAQGRVIAAVAGANRRVEDLLHDAVVAPFVMKIDDIPAADGGDLFRRVDVWYVAYGKLDALFTEESFAEMVEFASGQQKSRLPVSHGVVSEDRLRKLGIAIAGTADRKEQYCYGAFDLFDRVLLRSTRRVVATRGHESIVVASLVDPRFNGDAQHPNQWQPVQVDAQRAFKLGPPKPYVSSGSYCKITRLAAPPAALFIEGHHLFAEPQAWFGGKNLMRAKLPLAVQDSVRKLRRQLRADSAAPPEK